MGLPPAVSRHVENLVAADRAKHSGGTFWESFGKFLHLVELDGRTVGYRLDTDVVTDGDPEVQVRTRRVLDEMGAVVDTRYERRKLRVGM